MKELSERLLLLVQTAEPKLRVVSDEESAKPVLPGGWSRKQVLGHLIDSASNNHQRFVRAMLADSLDFPGYDQEGSVRVQAAQELVGPGSAMGRLQSHARACDRAHTAVQARDRLPHWNQRAG
jgi:hypothetical protein